MKLDKYDRMFIAFMFVVVTIFNIGQCFASEVENVDVTQVPGIVLNNQTNYFVSSTNGSVGYFPIEKGYIYTIQNNGASNYFYAFSDEIPALNGTYYNVSTLHPNETYSFISSDSNYFYFDYSWYDPYHISITKEKIPGQETAVQELVDNVGVNQLWSVFESGVDFIGVIVLVAFGLFLVFLLIKKISKGKSDF